MLNFFERETSKYYKTGYLPIMKDRFNANNILTLNKKKVFANYTFIDEKDFLAYRFAVLKEWMRLNERFDKIYLLNLHEVIKNLNLEEEFNSYEYQYIQDVESIVFAQIRNLKQLIVDFAINKSELVFYRYEIKSFDEIIKKGTRTHFINCDIYITNQRIIISEHLNTISIDYSQIKNYEFSMNKLAFNLLNGKKYCINSLDIPTIYVSLERVLKREEIFLNK